MNMDNKRKILIDTDPGIDDGCAILCALADEPDVRRGGNEPVKLLRSYKRAQTEPCKPQTKA